ncbi:MAG: formylglycine-generating enzyme family protein, partial [Actinomycetia bacterium]|nr:formylglycine-generating enzyme family protein [Actinomycetes bacterium]
MEGMQLCWVPPGAFRMGADKSDALSFANERPVSDPSVPYGFWIGRFPVTQAQFQAFTADDGYRDERYWGEAREAGHWRQGRFTIRDSAVPKPAGYVEPFGFLNHPVVGVSWYEARA